VPAARAIIHVDMDAFYASVEQRDDPALRGRPVIVGGHPTRGVVLAASYEVRPSGVRSAMPMVQALRLAPEAVVVPPRPEAYAAASHEVFAIFESVTPLVEALSLDEAFLDVTDSRALFGAPWEIAEHVRARIARELHLPASAGIAEVKFVAKIASDLAKPNGQKEVPPGGARAFLRPLALGRLWGVGPKTERALAALGLRTIGDLAALDPAWVERKLGGGRQLWDLANGIDPRAVEADRGARSLGAEDTFEDDVAGVEAVAPHIHAQALRVGFRLRRAQLKARVVQLKLKDEDFRVTTRRATLAEPTDDGQAIYRVAIGLLERDPPRRPLRLTGVAGQDLVGDAAQLGLFRAGPSRRDRLNAALDRITDRFGEAAVTTADLARADTPRRTLRGGRPRRRDPR
jgi:DNA polymerase-4